MSISRAVMLLALMSFPALAKVSLEEKVMRVESLKKLTTAAPMLSIEAYERELVYENLGYSLEQRANAEANLLVSKMSEHILSAYEEELLATGSANEAIANVKAAIVKDLELADPALRDELLTLSSDTLKKASQGGISKEVETRGLQARLLKGVTERSNFLNKEKDCCDEDKVVLGGDPVYPTINRSKDSEKKEYATKEELLSSLVSDRDSTRWVSTSNQSINIQVMRKSGGKVNLQVKIEFLGVGIDAGPQISFKREFATNATIMAEGLRPVLLSDGNFDFFKRDGAGKIIVKNGKGQRRFISFICDTELNFVTEYTGQGGFTFMGMGAESSYSRDYGSKVSMTSRRVALPEYVNGKTATLKFLSDLCHNDFLNARFTNTMTVRQSLETMMKNLVASLRFSHPKTKCAIDEHCFDWFNKEIIALARVKNYPRCVEEKREKFFSCSLRGLKGQNCALYDKAGARISSGSFEFACDKGLKCVQTKEGGWFSGWELYQYPQGQCMPVNARTYKDPYQQQKEEESRYIEINLL